jgi:hypothetical protein
LFIKPVQHRRRFCLGASSVDFVWTTAVVDKSHISKLLIPCVKEKLDRDLVTGFVLATGGRNDNGIEKLKTSEIGEKTCSR